MQKKWAVGGGIGAAALVVGYALFHSRPAHAFPSSRQLPHHEHHKRKKHPHDREDGGADSDGENARGEYGQRSHKHKRGHDNHG